MQQALEEAAEFADNQAWPVALAAARRVERWSAEHSTDDDVKDAAQQIRRDQATTMRMDGEFDFVDTIPDYRAAFREYGIDVERLLQREAARRIRESAIHTSRVGAAVGGSSPYACIPDAMPHLWKGEWHGSRKKRNY